MPQVPEKKSRAEAGQVTDKASAARVAVLEVLARAANDRKFLARLAENPGQVLREFRLSREEHVALARGDIETLESWFGTLDDRLRTWPNVRQAQDKW